jgi:type II secretory ATPase GspE/PulE/Tfp pilus assembly ATPase PilB-like protein/RNA polymerase subunit RPABC4/transcription elongation factor Spt4
VVARLARLSEIEKAIEFIYSNPDEDSQPVVQDFGRLVSEEEIDVLLEEEEAETAEQLMARSSTPSAVQMVNSIIVAAIHGGASDIHIEPKTGCTLVRYRIDGLLEEPLQIPARHHLATVSRLKILAKMDIAERRIPQDGRITVRLGDKLVDIRVSSMPTINGEKIVCRLLDKTASVRSLDKIGVTGKALGRLRNIISTPQGMIIATGPTGSGKTTSLYALMTERLSPSLNFVTIEDPVEYYLEKASQVHVRQKIGLTFASSLRCTLRQDPDVILVGEIRDTETAQAAFQAAMTGHLVFTSLHTNSTIATISRLFHLDVEPYLVASAVQGVIAQRLVRKLCPECKEMREFDKDLLRVLGIANDGFPDRLYYGRGCEKCGNSGFLGRIGLFEVFQMNDEFRQFLTTNYQESRLLNMARSLGMETILENGVKKVLNGQTTLEELLRVLGPASAYDYHCKNCGRDLDVKFSTCPYCGTPQRLICQNCHARLEPDWVACPYCGQK